MKIEIEGMSKAIKNLRNKKDKAPEVIEGWLNEHGDDALERVQMRTPVGETGDLRRNWEKQSVEKQGDSYSIEITNNVEYLPHVEYGHRQEVGRYVPSIGKRLLNSVVPGVFMTKISREITKEAMESDKKNLAKRISGAK